MPQLVRTPLPNDTADEKWMRLAIAVAKRAMVCGMRPFGSVIVSPQGALLGQAAGSETPINTTRHSEVQAIRCAERTVGGLLHGCALYQTHEPCTYCVGAILHSKLSRVVTGSLRSDLPQLFRQKQYTSAMLLGDTTDPPIYVTGVLRGECVDLFLPELARLSASA